MNNRRPGGRMASRPLHFFWLADCSGSMGVDGKIQALNNAIRESVPHMQSVARDNPHASVLARCVRFSTGASWHVGEPTLVEDFLWPDLKAEGVTDLGAALDLLTEQLKMPPMSDRALPPVIALISDGCPTDHWQHALDRMMAEPWGRKAIRIAIGIGEDAANDDAQEVFARFIANPTIRPLQANNPEALVGYIRWVSTAIIKSSSSPASLPAAHIPPDTNVPLPEPPSAAGGEEYSSVSDVW